jgi:hypothetical protein
VVLLVYGLVRLVTQLADRHVHRAVGRQLQLAGTRFAEHPFVAEQLTGQPVGQQTRNYTPICSSRELTQLESVTVAARREVARLGAQYAESASWLYEDSRDLATAYYWNNRAMEWAHEAGDDLLLSWTLFRRSQQVVATGNATHVLSLAHAAR